MKRRACLPLVAVLTLWSAQGNAAGFHYERDQNLIVIDGVATSPGALHAAMPQVPLAPVDGQRGTWLLRANILVRGGGTLRVHGHQAGGEVDELRLKSDNVDAPGAFVSITADHGWLDIKGTRITSWDSAAQGPDTDYDNGRAFIRARSRLRTMNLVPEQSRMDVIDSEISFLGYNAGESYGLTWKVVAPESASLEHTGVYGSVVNSRIHDNFVGVYSTGLRGGKWQHNEIDHNARYGLAPHTGSDGLLIEDNAVHDNGDHGITVRKDCERVVIRRNRVWSNSASGISVHDGPRGTLIEANLVHHNADSGILIHASTGTTVRGNTVRDNTVTGIQLAMGAAGNHIEDNQVFNNGLYGVYVGRGRGQPTRGDGQPRSNEIVRNAIYGSGTDNVRPEQPALNRYADNTFTDPGRAPAAVEAVAKPAAAAED